MVDVRGRWALVTGASRGIGRGIAVFMAKKGCNLILVSRDEKHCERVLTEVKKYGVESYALGCELSDESDIKRMLGEIDKRGNKVDIIYNNAAIQGEYMHNYCQTDPKDYVNCFKVNVVAPAMIMYHFLPGVVVGAFVDDKKSGRHLAAGYFYGMSLEEAVDYAEWAVPPYTGSIGI